LRRVDQNLYAAKSAGRDQVCYAIPKIRSIKWGAKGY
jgi:hypothetical protein